MDGNIIDIKRFTLHDGYGIRSTVFLKGCGLHCAWCHNPEGIDNRVELWYLPRQCIHCHTCLEVCPEKALSVDEVDEQSIVINRQRCTNCGLCVEACPTNALAFDGRRLSSEAVAEILLSDRQFYSESGGGITISGGDPLIQQGFAREILGLCKAEGLHTAIETCLQGSWTIIEGFLPLVDLFIVDLKLADARLHREYTGHDNGLIRENYRRLASLGRDLLTRIPLIPRVTARRENIQAIASFIAECNPGGRVELINFNPLAENKYLLMNRDREFFRNMSPLDAEELAALRTVLEAEGLSTIKEHRV
ncbi:MAG TPA: glycyl-radical enzyme activating protein [Rectinemataceae bacterium]|nr:glycyl-radical enzyme activating protein [Rectinemataceae bacterium]